MSMELSDAELLESYVCENARLYVDIELRNKWNAELRAEIEVLKAELLALKGEPIVIEVAKPVVSRADIQAKKQKKAPQPDIKHTIDGIK